MNARRIIQLCVLWVMMGTSGAYADNFTLEGISLNPTNFFVDLRLAHVNTNAVDVYLTVYGYDGPPVDLSNARPVRVSDCYQCVTTSMVFRDTSAPLSELGRTYYIVAVRGDASCCLNPTPGPCNIVYSRSMVYAAYPFLTNPFVTGASIVATGSIPQIQVTFGQDLYTNTYSLFATNAAGFFRVLGTNLLPSNAVIEGRSDMLRW